jgi:hypothetical protein
MSWWTWCRCATARSNLLQAMMCRPGGGGPPARGGGGGVMRWGRLSYAVDVFLLSCSAQLMSRMNILTAESPPAWLPVVGHDTFIGCSTKLKRPLSSCSAMCNSDPHHLLLLLPLML